MPLTDLMADAPGASPPTDYNTSRPSNMHRHLVLLGILVAQNSFAVDLIAHRGGACAKHENSIEAIRSAWDVGADAIEIDLRVSADGVPYLFHDDKIGGQSIQTLPYSEIQAKLGDAAPELASVFELGPPPGYYILDLKGRSPGVTEAIASTIGEWQFDQRSLIFQSADVSLLVSLRKQFSVSRFFYLARLKTRFPLGPKPKSLGLVSRLSGSGIDGVSLKGRSYLDANYVALLKNNGYAVNVWTINDAARADFYSEIGVDGIITDKLVEIRGRLDDGESSGGECGQNSLTDR